MHIQHIYIFIYIYAHVAIYVTHEAVRLARTHSVIQIHATRVWHTRSLAARRDADEETRRLAAAAAAAAALMRRGALYRKYLMLFAAELLRVVFGGGGAEPGRADGRWVAPAERGGRSSLTDPSHLSSPSHFLHLSLSRSHTHTHTCSHTVI